MKKHDHPWQSARHFMPTIILIFINYICFLNYVKCNCVLLAENELLKRKNLRNPNKNRVPPLVLTFDLEQSRLLQSSSLSAVCRLIHNQRYTTSLCFHDCPLLANIAFSMTTVEWVFFLVCCLWCSQLGKCQYWSTTF